jgi:hypothetical protein
MKKMEENQMIASEKNLQLKKQYGLPTRLWAGLCHNCGICPFADKKPNSAFGKVMRWHRTWCPGWAGHTKVYGRKPLS